MAKRSVSSARAARVVKNAPRTSKPKIDFSDIPDSSPAQLQADNAHRVAAWGGRSRQLIAIRVDPDVLAEFRKEARRRRVGYQTLMNAALAEHIRKDVA